MNLKITSTVILLTFCLMLTSWTQTDSIRKYSLTEAKVFALENNTEIKNAELDLESAKRKIWETTAIGLPQLSASVDYQHIPDPPTTSFPSPDGQTMDIMLAQENNITYAATLSQLVFSGEYIVGLQASKAFYEMSSNQHAKTSQNIKENVSSTYYSILILEANKAVLDSNISNIAELVEESEELFKQGFTEDTDVEQLRLMLSNLENSAISVENQISTMYKLLNIHMGLPSESVVSLSENLDDLLQYIEIENIEVSPFEITSNIDYQSLKTFEKIDLLSLKREKSLYLPQVAAFYKYSDVTEKADFDMTINQIMGVSVSIPVFSSGLKNARVQQAAIELQKTKNSKSTLEQNLKVLESQAISNYNLAKIKLDNQRKSLGISERIYSKTRIKKLEGIASSMDLKNAHNQYLENYSDYTNAILELLLSKLELDKLHNRL